MKNRVHLMICGTEYIVNSEDEPGYVETVGQKVNDRIYALLEANNKFSLTMAAIFAGLSWCDETSKLSARLDEIDRAAALLQENLAASSLENKELSTNFLTLQREYRELLDDLATQKAAVVEKDRFMAAKDSQIEALKIQILAKEAEIAEKNREFDAEKLAFENELFEKTDLLIVQSTEADALEARISELCEEVCGLQSLRAIETAEFSRVSAQYENILAEKNVQIEEYGQLIAAKNEEFTACEKKAAALLVQSEEKIFSLQSLLAEKEKNAAEAEKEFVLERMGFDEVLAEKERMIRAKSDEISELKARVDEEKLEFGRILEEKNSKLSQQDAEIEEALALQKALEDEFEEKIATRDESLRALQSRLDEEKLQYEEQLKAQVVRLAAKEEEFGQTLVALDEKVQLLESKRHAEIFEKDKKIEQINRKLEWVVKEKEILLAEKDENFNDLQAELAEEILGKNEKLKELQKLFSGQKCAADVLEKEKFRCEQALTGQKAELEEAERLLRRMKEREAAQCLVFQGFKAHIGEQREEIAALKGWRNWDLMVRLARRERELVKKAMFPKFTFNAGFSGPNLEA